MKNEDLYREVRRAGPVAVHWAVYWAVDTSQSGVNRRAVDDAVYMLGQAGGERQPSPHPGLGRYLEEVPW